MYYESNYLAHHGVKGMKWGVRKRVESSGTNRKQGNKNKKKYINKELAFRRGRYGKAQWYARKGLTDAAVAVGSAAVASLYVQKLAKRGHTATAAGIIDGLKGPVRVLTGMAAVETGMAAYNTILGIKEGDKKERYLQKKR